MRTLLRGLQWLIAAGCFQSVHAIECREIVVPAGAHPAAWSAARIIANGFGIPASAIHTNSIGQPATGVIVLTTAPVAETHRVLLETSLDAIKHDGYAIAFQNGGAVICAKRPRALLFAAGDLHQWKGRTSGTVVRDPGFAIRSIGPLPGRSVPDYVASMGANLVIAIRDGTPTLRESVPELWSRMSESEQGYVESQNRSARDRTAAQLKACRDADVSAYAFLYGNDFRRWSPTLHAAAVRAFPAVQGKPAVSSWEQASLCPSEPMTWKLIEGYVKEFAQTSQADGICATFWDHYGLYCQCDRCMKSGMNQFPNQLYECVKHYRNALAPLGKKLIVRTWSSGVPHWFEDQWVHAPGYDHFGGSGVDLWGRVIRELPKDIILQTKVYHSDCFPDARFSELLGKCGPHPEIAEYQMAGQTTGRYYFPASTVDHTVRTMRESLRLVGTDGGVNVFPGGTQQSNYDPLDDIVNNINLYAWRELSWQVDRNADAIWMEWAVSVYGEKAAPHMVRALKLSERAVNGTFSTLGLGSDTNSGFPQNIKRRETLLKYTNRYYQAGHSKFLEPTRENIQRVIDEKAECLRLIDEMIRELELAKPHLRRDQALELTTRFDWLREFAIVEAQLEESLWRYRYLRHLAGMLTTEPEQLLFLARSYDAVKQHESRLFRFDPQQKFSCYSVPLGRLGRIPSLGSPMPLMQELYKASRAFVEDSVGPGGVPEGSKR